MSDESEDFDQAWQSGLERPYGKYALWTGFLAFAGVGLALVLQHMSGMEPCAWCTFQRLLFIVLGALAIASWLMAGTPVIARVLSALAALTGIGGIAAALYQHFVAAPSGSSALTFADQVINGLRLNEIMPWLFEATAMCDEANVPMLGVPFAFWSAMLFLILTLVLLIVTFSKGAMR